MITIVTCSFKSISAFDTKKYPLTILKLTLRALHKDTLMFKVSNNRSQQQNVQWNVKSDKYRNQFCRWRTASDRVEQGNRKYSKFVYTHVDVIQSIMNKNTTTLCYLANSTILLLLQIPGAYHRIFSCVKTCGKQQLSPAKP